MSNRTKLEMSRLNIRTYSEMFQIIDVTEQTMIAQLKEISMKYKQRVKNKMHNIKKEIKTRL